ncbi:MAG: flagellar basal body P-ring formation chaperone FlgA [Acetobacter fabarum]|jgi:flagella basal body P-ring formation protein FlgA|uniref:Flagella basal body P-ring formation protein FlgA n=1 Tax=Acetobacter fabarum TaxID=483199 RepID=A0A269XY56_9PROT|nr:MULTISPECIES: flagellar basal body P-ring formation chaperone FlgA [Acetobacter]MDN6713054.1 flagellar basal body P-ring formation chaperone FlgA [Acetobacter sp.]MCI1243527.1 flagellar basal body P-ring formation chaperone FlgA [Acetobacter fabarum]MCI1909432.1 flagellar basal body P-ring formation chaperone FlgA [Acetobacter fabarum]MCI1927410.1 flagellar basal body P-ring formation chaperone FlgA [Acetobacter fabarum]MCI1947410.1 flagellar basal body P-ring formation chaperone FlgA [Acet
MSLRAAILPLLAAVFAVLPPAACLAATLRTATTVTSDTVRLSDLFMDLEPGQDRVLGPAPLPGSSFVVGGRQLLAIADQYGVDWMDQSATAQTTVTRAGRVLDRDFFIHMIKQNLPDLGEGPVTVELGDFHPMTVAADDPKPVVMSDLDWDQKSGRFSATVYRTHPLGDITQDSFLLTGVVHAAQRVLVYTHALSAGTVLAAADVRVDDSYTGRSGSKAYTADADVAGMTLLHSVMVDEPVLERDLRRTIVMHKGDPIMLSYIAPGLRLSATGRALEDGGVGQYVHALNLASKMILTGRVVNGSEMEVDTTSGAVPSDGNALRRLSSSSRSGGQGGIYPR